MAKKKPIGIIRLTPKNLELLSDIQRVCPITFTLNKLANSAIEMGLHPLRNFLRPGESKRG